MSSVSFFISSEEGAVSVTPQPIKLQIGACYIAIKTDADALKSAFLWKGSNADDDDLALALSQAEKLAALSPKIETQGNESDDFKQLFSPFPSYVDEEAGEAGSTTETKKKKKKKNKKKHKSKANSIDLVKPAEGEEAPADMGQAKETPHEPAATPAPELAAEPENLSAPELEVLEPTAVIATLTSETEVKEEPPVATEPKVKEEAPLPPTPPPQEDKITPAVIPATAPAPAPAPVPAAPTPTPTPTPAPAQTSPVPTTPPRALASPPPTVLSPGGSKPLPPSSPSSSFFRPSAPPPPVPDQDKADGKKKLTTNVSVMLKDAKFKLVPGSDVLPYDKLVTSRVEDGIDPTKKEEYLSEEEFKRVLGGTLAEFKALPAWKQLQKKKAVHLF